MEVAKRSWSRGLVRKPSAVFLVLLLTAAAFAQSSVTFQYIYDDLGQLVKVIDSTGTVIEYVYDPAGNMLEIKRSTVSGLAVFGFTPRRGMVGATVTIQGQAFSSVPAENVVAFNGTLASVSVADAHELRVTVPQDATTGPITVSVNGTSASSDRDFIVLPPPLGTAGNPAKSCLDILKQGAANGNGKYWIVLTSGAFEMECDFTWDSGGWTRVGALDGSQDYCTTSGFTDLRVNPEASAGKIPDTDARALMTGTPGSPQDVMYFVRGDTRYVWHALQSVDDFVTDSRHNSPIFYCSNWHCDNGGTDSSVCGSEGNGCPITAHGSPFTTKKIYVDSSFSAHMRGFHSNGSICELPNYTRAAIWVYVR